MMKFVVLALILTATPVAAAPPTQTATSPSTQAVDPAALAAADRLLIAMGYDHMMERSVDSMINQSGPALKRSIEADLGEEVDDELIKRLQIVQAEFLRKIVVNNADLRHAMATLYARHFTAPEIDHLAQLYSDPVMRKWADSAPALMGDMMPLMIDLISAHRDELRTRLKQVATDYYAEKESPGKS